MKSNDTDIHRLVERFMDGDTTLDEERRLYAYFAGREVAADLEPLRPMFLGLESMATMGRAEKEGRHTPEQRDERAEAAPHRMRLHPWWAAVAASLLALLVVSAALYVGHRENYCEAYVYGQKVTDPTVIRTEMAHTMKAVGIEDDNGVDDQLHDVLMTDN